MKKMSFSLILVAFLALTIVFPASAEISAKVAIQRYGVKNLSKNESVYSQNIKALEDNELEFSINLKNSSSHQANGAILYVYLPIGFPLDNNSIYIDGTRTGGNISNGLYLGNINANSQKDIIFKTRINNFFNGYAAIQVLVTGDNFNTDSQYISVTKNGPSDNPVPVFTPSPSPWPAPTPTPVNQSPILRVSVLGKNLTKQNTDWQKTVKAEPGDLIQFSVMLTVNTSVAVKNVYLKDTLDSFLDFVPGSVIINNTAASDTLINGRLFVGDLTSQEAKFVKFQARVQNAPQFGKETIVLSNTARAWAENNVLISDFSSVSVTIKQARVKPVIPAVTSIKKTVSENVSAPVKKEVAVSKNSFLGGIIGFDNFCLLLILILLALVILLSTFLAQEKKKNKEKTAI